MADGTGSGGLRVDAFFDTGDAAALERWKRAHPDWFVAGWWTPPGAARSDGSVTGDRMRGSVVPVSGDGPGGGAAWERAAPLDARDPGVSVADFVAVAARARGGGA